MRHNLKVGSKVLCRYFNTPDNRFYGESFEAEVLATDNDKTQNYRPARPYLVKRSDDGRMITLLRKEIKRVLS
jgi:hypothetical protein